MLTRKELNYKYGTQQAKNVSELLHRLIIKEQWALFLSMIVLKNKPSIIFKIG
jgi:hypothetical protein